MFLLCLRDSLEELVALIRHLFPGTSEASWRLREPLLSSQRNELPISLKTIMADVSAFFETSPEIPKNRAGKAYLETVYHSTLGDAT